MSASPADLTCLSFSGQDNAEIPTTGPQERRLDVGTSFLMRHLLAGRNTGTQTVSGPARMWYVRRKPSDQFDRSASDFRNEPARAK
jgi:hypothetical protein